MIRFILAVALGAACCYGAAEVPGAVIQYTNTQTTQNDALLLQS